MPSKASICGATIEAMQGETLGAPLGCIQSLSDFTATRTIYR